MMSVAEMQNRYERLLEEERERTTVMTLANDDKRRELRTLTTDNERLKKELAFFMTTEKGKLRETYIKLRTFAQRVADFCDEDSDGHMKYLKTQAEIAMREDGT